MQSRWREPLQASANGIAIEYETFGSRGGAPVLLIMGLGCQLTFWDDQFCEMLATRGCYVIRFDNRDVGLSSKFDSAGVPDIATLREATTEGRKAAAPYLIEDMATDAIGLLDSLEVDKASVVGLSMGGMIAQAVAIQFPDRVKSLVSIMSATGDPDEPRSDPEVFAQLMAPPPPGRDATIEQSVEISRMLSGPGFPFPEDRIRERAAKAYDRSFHPQGTIRQFAAIIASDSRTQALSDLDLPTLVIHGDADQLIPVGCGQMTAAAIPNARLLQIEGMGHDFPVELAAEVADAVANLATE